MITAKATARFAGGLTPLVALALGPNIHGSAIGGVAQKPWAAWIDSENILSMARTDAISAKISFAPFANVDIKDFKRISLSFDQAGNRVFAWQIGETITASRLDVSTHGEIRFSFSGVDPILLNDGQLLEVDKNHGLSDVILFYLDTARTAIKYRLQTDAFSVEYDYLNLPTPHSLDAWARRGLSLALYVSTHAQTSAAVSQPYPAYIYDAASFGVRGIGGVYFDTVVRAPNAPENSLFGVRAIGGIYSDTIVYPGALSEQSHLSLKGFGSFSIVIIPAPESVTDASKVNVRANTGSYVVVVVDSGQISEATNLEVRAIGGDYI